MGCYHGMRVTLSEVMACPALARTRTQSFGTYNWLCFACFCTWQVVHLCALSQNRMRARFSPLRHS
eukprot:1150334-Pelagomonas_calceolata.AAC.8